MNTPVFDPSSALRYLTRHGVDFVVIGGIAAIAHGSPRVTGDLDIAFSTAASNLEALGAALTELGARLRGIEDDLPFVPDPRTLRQVELLTLETSAGDLDVHVQPSGAPAYKDLRARAERKDLGGIDVAVASIDDLIAMKTAAGRPKDLADIAELSAIKRIAAEEAP